MKYQLKIFDNELNVYLEEKIVEASSSSIARKLADIHFEKYKIAKLENQVRSYEDKVLILKREKETQLKIENWKDRLRNKENESLAKELNRILNG